MRPADVADADLRMAAGCYEYGWTDAGDGYLLAGLEQLVVEEVLE